MKQSNRIRTIASYFRYPYYSYYLITRMDSFLQTSYSIVDTKEIRAAVAEAEEDDDWVVEEEAYYYCCCCCWASSSSACAVEAEEAQHTAADGAAAAVVLLGPEAEE